MRLTVKNYKHIERMSEETDCFTASLYLDGKRIGTAENAGHGGPDDYFFETPADKNAFDTFVEEWVDSDEARNDPDNWINGTYCACDEVVVYQACRNFCREQTMKKALKNCGGNDFTTVVLIERPAENGCALDMMTIALHPHHNVSGAVDESQQDGDTVYIYTAENGVLEYEKVTA